MKIEKTCTCEKCKHGPFKAYSNRLKINIDWESDVMDSFSYGMAVPLACSCSIKTKESKYDDIKNFIEECIEGVENGIIGASVLADHRYCIKLDGMLYAYKNVLSFIKESENDNP